MKANELRIGNYVRSIGIDYMVWKIDALGNIQGIEGSTTFNLDKTTESIPLTEEWLLKFGFEKKENSLFTKIFEYTYNSLKYFDEYKRWIYYNDDNDAGCNAIADLNYVHELQNLYFALTKEELTMK